MRPNNLYQGNGPIKNYNKSTWDPWVNKLIWFLKGNHLCLRQFLHQYTTNHATTETTLLSNSNHILNLHTYHNIYHTLKIINTSPKCHTPCQLPYDLKSITMGKAIKYTLASLHALHAYSEALHCYNKKKNFFLLK